MKQKTQRIQDLEEFIRQNKLKVPEDKTMSENEVFKSILLSKATGGGVGEE